MSTVQDPANYKSPRFVRLIGGRGLSRHGAWIALLIGLLTLAGAAIWKTTVADDALPSQRGKARASAPPIEKLPGSPADQRAVVTAPVAQGDDAIARNEAVPFVTGPLHAAPPFRFSASSEDRQRAIDCLALAAMAEAGGGDVGQRAVMQVVLNRVRHPAFAKTVCGVVFEGAERDTGCQFTFTCDGALARRYSDPAWAAARRRAAEALNGYVFAKVGTATHYHTDWVYPYWSPSLDKVAKVDTHLFFRWKGYWGSPASFRTSYHGGESTLVALMNRAGHSSLDTVDVAGEDLVVPVTRNLAATPARADGVVSDPEGGAYLVSYAGTPTATQALASARRLCGGNGYCRVMGWTDRSAMPKGFPVPPASRASLSFSYVLDAQNKEIVLYDCRTFRGIPRESCIPAPVRPT